MLKIRLANNAGLAMRAATVVTSGKLIDAQHLRAALGQVIGRGAADAAGA